MIQIQQLKLAINHTEMDLKKQILKRLRIKEAQLLSYQITKKSIDARKKPQLMFVYTIEAKVQEPQLIMQRIKDVSIKMITKNPYQIPTYGDKSLNTRPVVVGFGPAGMFCGLLLARAGFCPIILERGEAVDTRQQKVTTFWNGGSLDTESNVQFGEGGAGTFSDGKLNTSVKDPFGRNRYVLETLVKAGAAEEILYLNKPHVGTDILCNVVKNIRKEILSLGGEIRFSSKVTDLVIKEQQLQAVIINESERIAAEKAILAIGHSARDTFFMLQEKSLYMKAKSFAVGIRIEHPQAMINANQYGIAHADNLLPAADYKLTRQLANGRGIYSFCMCPGGYIVNASSEHGMTAVNGMSYQNRGSKNANSAMVVTVTPADFCSTDALAGIAFQRQLETAAFNIGKGMVPLQLFEDFVEKRVSKGFGDVTPQIKGGYTFAALHTCFPDTIYQSLKEGIMSCGEILSGFNRTDAILAGVESRTSSPVRIERNSNFESNIGGMIPCGEGAGYAGGITSAAIDGLKAAETIISEYEPNLNKF